MSLIPKFIPSFAATSTASIPMCSGSGANQCLSLSHQQKRKRHDNQRYREAPKTASKTASTRSGEPDVPVMPLRPLRARKLAAAGSRMHLSDVSIDPCSTIAQRTGGMKDVEITKPTRQSRQQQGAVQRRQVRRARSRHGSQPRLPLTTRASPQVLHRTSRPLQRPQQRRTSFELPRSSTSSAHGDGDRQACPGRTRGEGFPSNDEARKLVPKGGHHMGAYRSRMVGQSSYPRISQMAAPKLDRRYRGGTRWFRQRNQTPPDWSRSGSHPDNHTLHFAPISGSAGEALIPVTKGDFPQVRH
jgi:hypothetical protein